VEQFVEVLAKTQKTDAGTVGKDLLRRVQHTDHLRRTVLANSPE